MNNLKSREDEDEDEEEEEKDLHMRGELAPLCFFTNLKSPEEEDEDEDEDEDEEDLHVNAAPCHRSRPR